jgi:leucyl/phenylalanyl-tRNA--protein transferase
MFTRVTNASKVALVALVNYVKDLDFAFIDCQIATPHLMRFGAREISRTQYLDELNQALIAPTLRGKWSFES